MKEIEDFIKKLQISYSSGSTVNQFTRLESGSSSTTSDSTVNQPRRLESGSSSSDRVVGDGPREQIALTSNDAIKWLKSSDFREWLEIGLVTGFRVFLDNPEWIKSSHGIKWSKMCNSKWLRVVNAKSGLRAVTAVSGLRAVTAVSGLQATTAIGFTTTAAAKSGLGVMTAESGLQVTTAVSGLQVTATRTAVAIGLRAVTAKSGLWVITD